MDSRSFVDRTPNQKADRKALTKASKALFKGKIKSEELGIIRKAYAHTISITDIIRGQTSEGGEKSLLQIEGLVFMYQPEVSSFVNEGVEISIVSEEIPGEIEPLCSFLFRASDYVKSVLSLQWTLRTREFSNPDKNPLYITYRTLNNVHNVSLGRVIGGVIGHWKENKDGARTHKFTTPSGYTKVYPGEYALDISHMKYYHAGGSYIVQSSSDLRNFVKFKQAMSQYIGDHDNDVYFDILSRSPLVIREAIQRIMDEKPKPDDYYHIMTYVKPMRSNVHVPSIGYRDLISFTKEEVSSLTYFNTGDEIEEPQHLETKVSSKAAVPAF
ncbi:4 [Maize fine streak virus]|uniref:4 protein n=1 Tax=Maize fine streak virus TaxID=209854 RepID=Q6E0X5_9RHAB|nr:4 [Maize fine streak nucleorhabdovirus] [Maize fine streak virus]AAT66747.1 4 [Maize fine streak nucleorhabdovirus] [Maize fine streak virus]